MKNFYRLPNGKNTSNVDEYVNAWKELGNFIEKNVLPGYHYFSFDPCITFALCKKTPFSTVITVDECQMSVQTIMTIKKSFERLKKKKK